MVRSLSAFVMASLLTLVSLAPPVHADEGQEWSARHILVAYKGAMRSAATRTKEEALALAMKALAAVKAPNADFAAASNQYSDDKGSNARGGSLGVFAEGQMVPEFQKALEGLKEGEIVAAPVESPFGFHIIQRLAIERVVLTGALFGWTGLENVPADAPKRTKEQALADAQAFAQAAAGGKRFQDVKPSFGAAPLFKAPTWMPQIIRRGTIRPEFKMIEDQGFALAENAVSGAFETPAGFIVLRRTAYFRLRAKHLVVSHSGASGARGVLRTKDEAKARAEEALKKLTADPTSWGKIVAEYSDEPQAGPREGALPVEPGELVGEFEEAVLALPPGGMSGLVETAFGFHIIRRLD